MVSNSNWNLNKNPLNTPHNAKCLCLVIVPYDHDTAVVIVHFSTNNLRFKCVQFVTVSSDNVVGFSLRFRLQFQIQFWWNRYLSTRIGYNHGKFCFVR